MSAGPQLSPPGRCIAIGTSLQEDSAGVVLSAWLKRVRACERQEGSDVFLVRGVISAKLGQACLQVGTGLCNTTRPRVLEQRVKLRRIVVIDRCTSTHSHKLRYLPAGSVQ